MATLSTSTWGDPSATKHVLLIHGITSSSQCWYRIAHEFASRGYFVIAPDLLGHGHARRGTDYTIAAMVEELKPLLTLPGHDYEHPYQIVIGHSLGGVVASALIPFLECSRPVRVVLVDPPLKPPQETTAIYADAIANNFKNPKTPEEYLRENPLWTREDAILKYSSVGLCDSAAVRAILEQMKPWSFAHLLSSVPDNVKVTVLAADPAKVPCVREEDLKPYPHVTVKTVWGASHNIPRELPLVVVDTALEGTTS
ncbi:Alpha/Beta hydrolase protein [Boletus edulis BED1]|uniref:Alpha/Beta hydrolase protein n=1 Tax=Boletus edulis BED1 TaxID=1328754 RepID=A0AAD4C4G0_BOLED|nr:Alpha/Beta hydrolase protein [Boletus edulis BED1]